MLNYFNFRKLGEKYLITNDEGRYDFVSGEDLKDLVADRIDYSSALGEELQRNHFIYQGSREKFLAEVKYPLRDADSHLLHCTGLHIFVLTNACNLQCIYCQARTGDEKQYSFMSEETAERAVDFALQSPDDYLTFEFQGGEPLMNFKTIRHIVEYAEAHKGRKNISYALVSNLILLTDEMTDFIKQYNIGVSTSLDGCPEVHNYNRPFIDGSRTFDVVKERIEHLQDEGICPGAIETTTRIGLAHARELIDTYISLGLDSVFIRPLTPLGYAYKDWEKVGYTESEFLQFYRECLDYILDLNRRGTFFKEGHASIFLSKIVNGVDPNYMELRSPCGGVLGQMAYFFNGDIYTCDEGRMLGEMGNDAFKLGNVFHSTFDQVVCSGHCKAIMSSSFLQSIPECCDCAYQPYCGTCPVVNYALYGDIYPTETGGYKCEIYRGMLDLLFGYLRDGDEELINILKSWVS